MSDRLLELQLELLLLRHGRRAVIDALATAGKMTAEELETAIATTQRSAKRKRTQPTAEVVAHRLFATRPEAIPLVQQLLTAYESRAFLPHLREVQRFVERAGVTRARLKSREAAVGQLVRALALMSDADLRQLAQSRTPSGTNDFEMLAHEIMGGTGRRKQP